MVDRKFGRMEVIDTRDKTYPVSSLLMEAPEITEKYWWDEGWWGDQGESTMCVCYSWLHWLEDGPVIQDAIPGRKKPIMAPEAFYKECQTRDQWEGENYPGTSVRAGAKILKQLGLISEYRWAHSVNEIINTILMLGPMVVGTKWLSGMSEPDRKGFIKPTGRDFGGHAYLLNGVDVNKGFFRVKNSWGKDWGKEGHAFLKIDDFEKLFNQNGEACIAVEVKINTVPDFKTLPPPELLVE